MPRGPKDSSATDPSALAKELARARARIDEQHALLEEAHRHAVANARFTVALGKLSRSTTLERAGLVAALVEVIQAAAECLEVTRVGVWLGDATFEHLECVALVQQGVVSRRPGTSLDRVSCPAYFAAASEERVLAITDVSSHPATLELLSGYLGPLGITSMLDAPIRVRGRVVGVVCHEHSGPRRTWSEVEQSFAAHVGDFVALAVEAFRREEARRAELDAETRYRQMVDRLPLVVYRIEPGRGLQYVSPYVTTLTGRPPTEWIGVDGLRAWVARIHPDDRDVVLERLRRTELPVDAGVDYRIAGAAGERWVHDVTHELRGADGRLLALEGVLTDITDRMRAHAEVRAWEQRLEALFSRSELALFAIDAKSRVKFVSGPLLSLLGRTAADVLGRSLDALLDGEQGDALEATVAKILESPQPEHAVEDLTIALPTSLRPAALPPVARTLRFRLVGLPKTHADAVLGVGVDVTALMELTARKLDAEKETSLVLLAAGVAHDVGNLLGAILLTTRTLQKAVAPDIQREALEHLSRCAAQASELNRRLLDVARSRPTEPRTLDVDEFLEREVPLFRSLLAGHGLTLAVHLDARGALVHVGTTELSQILLNLMTNAAEASPPGAPVTLRSARAVFPDTATTTSGHDVARGGYVAIEVEDEGPGIADDVARRVFDPYFSTKSRTDRDPESGVQLGGVGLGLATSRGLARQVGGELRAERGARGARFVLLLPIVDRELGD